MKIRLAEIEDAPAMARVIVDTFLASMDGILSEEAMQRRKVEWTHDVSAKNWRKAIEEIAEGVEADSCIYVAEDETGEVVGIAMGCPSQEEANSKAVDSTEAFTRIGEVDVLYVRQSHQQKGIGRALVKATAAHLARFGMKKLHICTPAANTEGRVFYDRLGGRIVGTRDDHNDGELITLVVYEWEDINAL